MDFLLREMSQRKFTGIDFYSVKYFFGTFQVFRVFVTFRFFRSTTQEGVNWRIIFHVTCFQTLSDSDNCRQQWKYVELEQMRKRVTLVNFAKFLVSYPIAQKDVAENVWHVGTPLMFYQRQWITYKKASKSVDRSSKNLLVVAAWQKKIGKKCFKYLAEILRKN